jgi:hypothetical protein
MRLYEFDGGLTSNQKMMALVQLLKGRAEDTSGKKEISTDAFIKLARNLGVQVTQDSLGEITNLPPLSNILAPYSPNEGVIKFAGNDEPVDMMTPDEAGTIVDRNAKRAMKRGAIQENSQKKNFLSEGLSSIVYHYTSLHSAVSILQSGKFELSSTVGSVEEEWAPRGYHYFMSTTRTKFGGFHDYAGNGGVMFNLDGEWYNNHYPAGPVDYWGNRDVSKTGRASESEDRIFSKTPSIPINGVTAVHVYVKPMDEKERQNWNTGYPAMARKALLLAKKQGIPAYLYEDEASWKRQSPNGRVEITKRETLSGPDLYKSPSNRRRMRTRTNWFEPWFQLINLDDTKKLGKKASSFAYDLSYDNSYYSDSMIKSLKNDLANARKPGSGNDREGAVKLIQFMRQNNLNTVEDFVGLLAKKWKAIKENERNSGEQQ